MLAMPAPLAQTRRPFLIMPTDRPGTLRAFSRGANSVLQAGTAASGVGSSVCPVAVSCAANPSDERTRVARTSKLEIRSKSYLLSASAGALGLVSGEGEVFNP